MKSMKKLKDKLNIATENQVFEMSSMKWNKNKK
jgi:hypothetical protein